MWPFKASHNAPSVEVLEKKFLDASRDPIKRLRTFRQLLGACAECTRGSGRVLGSVCEVQAWFAPSFMDVVLLVRRQTVPAKEKAVL